MKLKVTVRKHLDPKVFEKMTVNKVEQVCRQIYDGVVKRSPVLTGSYRASWTINLGSPNFDVVSGGSATAPLSPPTFQFPSGFKLGTPVFIANGQPYAARMETGWSKQAPAGVVRVTLAELRYL